MNFADATVLMHAHLDVADATVHMQVLHQQEMANHLLDFDLPSELPINEAAACLVLACAEAAACVVAWASWVA